MADGSKEPGWDKILNPFHTASDIMNVHVETLNMDNTVKTCLKFMDRKNVRHAVIVERPEERGDEPTFMGIISQRDVLRLTLPEKKQKGNDTIDPKALRQMLSVVVARNPISACRETLIPDVIETMINNRINIMPVLDGSKLVGIITTTDLMRMYYSLDKHLRQLNPKVRKDTALEQVVSLCSKDAAAKFTTLCQPVEKIMTKAVMSLGPHDTLGWAVDILNAEKFRHLLIADENQKLLGVMSDRDVLKHLPFIGRRPMSMVSVFKEHLLRIKPHTINLAQPLEKLITTTVKHASGQTTCLEATMTMISRKINCLPVVDKKLRILGLVTSTDLMRSLLDLYPAKNIEQ
jgi:CBS domain-containing membrane protein